LELELGGSENGFGSGEEVLGERSGNIIGG